VESIDKKCPKCGKPLILRRSIYGQFIGCTGYPKCRHTEKINGNNDKKTASHLADSKDPNLLKEEKTNS